jgi:hypothetical protein
MVCITTAIMVGIAISYKIAVVVVIDNLRNLINIPFNIKVISTKVEIAHVFIEAIINYHNHYIDLKDYYFIIVIIITTFKVTFTFEFTLKVITNTFMVFIIIDLRSQNHYPINYQNSLNSQDSNQD